MALVRQAGDVATQSSPTRAEPTMPPRVLSRSEGLALQAALRRVVLLYHQAPSRCGIVIRRRGQTARCLATRSPPAPARAQFVLDLRRRQHLRRLPPIFLISAEQIAMPQACVATVLATTRTRVVEEPPACRPAYRYDLPAPPCMATPAVSQQSSVIPWTSSREATFREGRATMARVQASQRVAVATDTAMTRLSVTSGHTSIPAKMRSHVTAAKLAKALALQVVCT